MHHVRALLAGARRSGIDTVPLLQEAQIPPLLLGDDRARVTPAQFARLFRALYRITQDEFLALGQVPSRPGTFAMMCHASLGCRDLGAAMERAAAFYGLFPGGPELALEVVGSEAWFAVRNDFARDEDRFLTECVLAIWHRLSSWLVGRRIPLAHAAFRYAPPPHRGSPTSPRATRSRDRTGRPR
ncbi:AraC family transcriptional regulator ligand-binding domain-containing protein [Streptomyces sp. BF23-19]|uniref:AraC family transcriptional regulator ligand-binding domain-containing protein n=1 Tax=unclassified Streptomyces TaxID=2593676 RepID=UPI0034E43797